MHPTDENEDFGTRTSETSTTVSGCAGVRSIPRKSLGVPARAGGVTSAYQLAGCTPLVALPVGFLTHVSWTVLVTLGALALVGAVAAEWQRRRTLVAVLHAAPQGTLIEQEGGAGGAFMRIRIGTSSRAKK